MFSGSIAKLCMGMNVSIVVLHQFSPNPKYEVTEKAFYKKYKNM